MTTPYENFESLPEARRDLKPSITFAALDAIAFSLSDKEAVKQANEEKRRLFKAIFVPGQNVA